MTTMMRTMMRMRRRNKKVRQSCWIILPQEIKCGHRASVSRRVLTIAYFFFRSQNRGYGLSYEEISSSYSWGRWVGSLFASCRIAFEIGRVFALSQGTHGTGRASNSYFNFTLQLYLRKNKEERWSFCCEESPRHRCCREGDQVERQRCTRIRVRRWFWDCWLDPREKERQRIYEQTEGTGWQRYVMSS